MAVRYQLTFICDNCSTEHMIDSGFPSLPPHWISSQIMISTIDGYIPDHEEDLPLSHFCSIECFNEHVVSQGFKERVLLVDRPDSDEEGDPQLEDQ